MPQITDYIPPKKFQKKEYRPWNILEEIKKEKPDLELPANYQQTESDITSKLPANYQQTESDITSKLPAIHRLCGLQKDVFAFIMNKIIDDFIVITSDELKHISNTSVRTIRNALDRLIDKGFFIRKKGKEGRGGFLVLSASILAQKLFLQEKEREKEKLPANYQQTTSCSSSYNNIYNTTTTNAVMDKFSFPEEWESIDIEPLAFIKFTKGHLDQIYKAGKISPDMLQGSIYAFAFDLQVNDKAKNLKLSPLNVFMGMMKRGNLYLPPENYESPEEKSMRLYLDSIKKRSEKLRKMQEECKAMAFEEWKAGFSEEEQKAVVPQKYHPDSEKKIFDTFIFSHFESKIWPSMKSAIETSALSG